jgi:hypothetical protein
LPSEVTAKRKQVFKTGPERVIFPWQGKISGVNRRIKIT